ncbi:hypothetical protein B0H14DRAFT_3855628, partial [Mycena olivaceomarginata]
MACLPPDILIEVFHLIPHPEIYWHRYGLLDVAAVNKAWRTAALESSSLWSCIRTETRRDLLLLPLLLERSRTSPLDVRLDFFCDEYGNPSEDTTPSKRAEVVQALLPHVRRIQKLCIRHQMLEPDSKDMGTISRLVDAGLEFAILTEYTHESLEAFSKASLDGVCPREWSKFLAPTLVDLHITSIDLDTLGTIFQQYTPGPLSNPGPLTPPPSIRTLDLQMSMPELVAVLNLFSTSPTLHSLTICDDQGLTARQLKRKQPHPILTHMLRGLGPLTAFEVYGDQDVVLRDAAGRARRFHVAAEDDPCYDTGALWAFLVARHDAHHTVRTILGTTVAWRSLASALERRQPEPPADSGSGVELQIILDHYGVIPTDDDNPIHLAALSKLTLQPPGGVRSNVAAVLQPVSMVRSERRGVVVCLGVLMLEGVAPRGYVAEYQKFVDGLKGVGPEGMWLPCAHCVARAEEIQDRGRWCVHCRMGDEAMKESLVNEYSGARKPLAPSS